MRSAFNTIQVTLYSVGLHLAPHGLFVPEDVHGLWRLSVGAKALRKLEGTAAFL